MEKNILKENMHRFGTKNLPLVESSLNDDDILDIIMTYTKDPDDAEAALNSYRETGKFGDETLEADVTEDPRWIGTDADVDNTNIDDMIDIFTAMIDDTNLTEQQSMITEGFVWTPNMSQGLADLGAMVGMGPVLSHFVLIGGAALAVGSPLIKEKYKSLMNSIKGRKLTNPDAFESFKNEMIKAAKNLPAGKRRYVTQSLNDIMRYSKNKEYERAFNTSQRLITYLRQ